MAKNIFNSVQLTRPSRNVFDLTHDVKFSADLGELIPVMVQECVPGDSFHVGGQALVRFAPLIAPVMHRFDVTIHYFFVPNRIIWQYWDKWITGGTGSDTVASPYLNISESSYNTYPLMDYMGIPFPGHEGTINGVSALPFGAYQKVVQDYYMDENLQPVTPDTYPCVSGNNTSVDLVKLGIRNWQHDYFTSALPFAQKGPAVDIPLGNVRQQQVYNSNVPEPPDAVRQVWDSTIQAGGDPSTVEVLIQQPDNTGDNPVVPGGRLFVPNSTVEPTSINDLRRAMRLQEWLERNARAGTRYTESILGHFGVHSSDKRLQRAEYITGVKSPVVISEVLNTTGEVAAEGLPQGNMAGHGVAVASGRFGSYFCEEHGFIIGIMSVMPLPAYQQGLPRHFGSRSDRLDYYWPEFANIGEQEVYNKELYIESADKEGVFGYVPRYAEYKYTPSRVAGDFKTSLNYWHLGRIFETEPALNSSFIQCQPGKRIFAVEGTADSLYIQILNRVKAVRPMPKFGTPTF